MRNLAEKLISTTAALLLMGFVVPLEKGQAQEISAVVPPAGAAMQAIRDKRPVLHSDGIRFGAYDPHGDFADQANVSTEALFLPWEDVDLSTLQTADAYARQRGRTLLISIEPWSWDVDWRLSSDQLRRKVLAGDYDGNMEAVVRAISQLKSPVIVRWGQEMEDTSGRFSWSGWPSQDYITAYRRMMDIVRRDAPSAQIMWSPKGMTGLNDYYPGDTYVDLVGLSVFGMEAYDVRAYGKTRNFNEALKQGYDLVARYDKPVWVAELGYEGSDGYMKPWIDTVTLKQSDFPRLAEVVYFNDRDVHPWPFDLGRPHWRVIRDDESN